MVCPKMCGYHSTKSLLEACQTLDSGAIQHLLHQGHNVNQVTTSWERHRPQQSCLHLCLTGSGRRYHKHRQRCLELLLREGANPNQRNRQGETPVMVAELNNDTGSMELLIKAGSDVNKISYNGKTALFNAITHGRLRNAALLLRAGADINEKHHGYKGFIIHSAKQGDVNMMKFLIKSGCDINQTCSERGATALHHSILSGRNVLEVLQLLIDEGADMNIMDHAGSRPIHWALIVKDKDAARFLLAQNVNLNTKYMTNESIFDYIYSLGLINFMEDCGYIICHVKKKIVFENIPTLKSLCRKTVRRALGTAIKGKISALPLPPSHKRYIQLTDLI